MDLRGGRIPIPGSTGEIGRALAVRLHTLGSCTARADRDHDVLVTVTGTAAESAPARMAGCAVAEAALASWLTLAHRPRTGSGVAVPEINLPHLDTGFAACAVVMIRPGAGPALEMVR
ncbi:hypothetical protein [Streptomyces sp. NBC_00696]|uniref:hypothetical protein n=1 Tax=Streptomyces sp. NBC_00696 TaxID=2903672 RepID=UPI002E36AC9C|nr:hypothetical protein [Streptomyces sp. NBC_00696]